MSPQEKVQVMTISVDQIHKDFGCKFNWRDSLTVIYKEKKYEIFDDVKNVVISCIIGDEMDAIAFSTSGIDFKEACRKASNFLIKKIIESKIE
ncbi:MAG: hypothetical protein ACTSVY_05665 [Candidatus Helarchaeota archaeon]